MGLAVRLGGDANQAFRGNAVGLLGGLAQALGAQPVNGGFDIAIVLLQRALAVHHARTRGVAQFLHQCGSDLRHGHLS